jgi:hypothetical protein
MTERFKVMFKEWLFLALMGISTTLFAAIPENDLDKADGQTWNISEQEFWDIIKFSYDIYKPIFDNLVVENGKVNWWFESNWQSKVVNIYAKKEKMPWNKWTIQLHGALARRPQLTKDGFALAICHEIGHLVGGYPQQDWIGMSTEGQADYYATHVCARKVFGAMEKKSPMIRGGVKVELCDKNFDTTYEQNVCYRSVFAAKSLADTLYVANRQVRSPEIDQPDTFKVKITYQLHTPAQCRLDTYLAGILCDKIWDDKRIPMEHNAVCRNRPGCWYSP